MLRRQPTPLTLDNDDVRAYQEQKAKEALTKTHSDVAPTKASHLEINRRLGIVAPPSQAAAHPATGPRQ
eukprot:m.7690 g.7690  ORF g.7690 m.7690 type:complete len:69 (+) comp8921_c0_seq1:79-285(+)